MQPVDILFTAFKGLRVSQPPYPEKRQSINDLNELAADVRSTRHALTVVLDVPPADLRSGGKQWIDILNVC